VQLTVPSAQDYLTTASKVKLEGLRPVPISIKEPIVVSYFKRFPNVPRENRSSWQSSFSVSVMEQLCNGWPANFFF
jgi:hypothetical protein